MVWSATSAGSREVDLRQTPWRRERSCADRLNCRSQQTPSRREKDSNPRSPPVKNHLLRFEGCPAAAITDPARFHITSVEAEIWSRHIRQLRMGLADIVVLARPAPGSYAS
jgi:hypothetical protein